MVSDYTVRMAQAMYEVSSESEQSAVWSDSFAKLSLVIEAVPGLMEYLNSPKGNTFEKFKLIETACSDSPTEFKNAIKLVVSHNSFFEFKDLATRFKSFSDQELGRIEVTITTALKTTVKQKNQFVEMLERRYPKKTIVPTFKTDKNLIGGAIIKSSTELIDYSYANSLKQLQQILT